MNNKLFEFQTSSGQWKPLHVLTWDEAKHYSRESGYSVREVQIYVISKTFDPWSELTVDVEEST